MARRSMIILWKGSFARLQTPFTYDVRRYATNKESLKNMFASILTRDMVGQPFPSTHPHLFPANKQTKSHVMEEEIAVGFTRGEFVRRRERLRELLLHDRQFVLLSASIQSIMTNDIPYTYRPDSNLYYLTGCMEQNCVLLLGKNRDASWLFVREKNGKEEQWNGPRSGVNAMHYLINGTNDSSGDLQVMAIDNLPAILKSILKKSNIAAANGNPLTIFMDPKKDQNIVQQVVQCAGGVELFANSSEDAIQNNKIALVLPYELLNTLRGIKSEQEIAILKRTAEISNQAFRATMSATKAGMSEAHLEAIMEFHVRLHGAQRLAYPPVVASGNNANVIHYVRNNSELKDGELVLIDAGAEYYLYPSDVTRVWPVNGKFTSAQRILYQAVLNVQKNCIQYLDERIKKKEPTTLARLHQFSMEELTRQLKDALSLNTIRGDIVEALCPHTIGHPLGMDIHEEVPAWNQLFHPGMVITVEPGVYMVKGCESLLNINNNDFFGNGIRIEDNILIKKDGIEVITANIPKEIEEIESICQDAHPLKEYIHLNYRH
jgi:Xaa-Pro aminopeptidase